MAQHTKENEEEDVFEPVVEVSEDVFEPEVVVSEDVFEPVVEVAEDVFEPEVVVAEEVFEPVDEQGNTIAAKTETVVTGERPYPLKDAESEGITANLMATMEVIDRPRAAMVSGVIEAIEQDDFDLAAIQAEMGVGIKGEDHPMLGEYLEAKIEQIKSNPDEYPISNVVVKSLDYVLNIPYEGYKIWANDVEKNSALTGSVLALISCGNDKECQQGRIENVITPLLQSTEQSIEKRKEGTFTTGVAYGIGFTGEVLLDPWTYTNPVLKWTNMGLRVMIPDAAMIKMVETTGKTKKQIKEAFLSTNTGQKLTEASDFVWALFSTKHDLKKLGVEGSKAYDLASKFKNLIAAARVKAVRDNIELQKRIRQFSKDTNVPVEEINKFITEAVERGGIPNVDVNHLSPETLKILAHNDDIRYEVWSLAKKNEAQLAAEVNAGVKLTPMREQPLITKDGDATLYLQYMNHAIKPEALKAAKKIEIRESGGKSLAAFFNSKHSSTFKRREDWLGLTINDINKLAKRGELPGYEGQVFKGGFFYDDPSILQALRDNKHYRSLAAVELAGDVIGPQGFGVSPTELIGLAKAAGWKTSKTRKKLTANEALKYLQEHSPREWMGWKITKNKYTNDWALPDDIAKFVDDNLVYLNDPKKVNMFLGQYDELTRWWKSWTLSVFPSYHIRNAVGNSWNNFVIGVKPQTYKDALLVQRGIAKNEAGTILINGKKVSYNQIRDWSDEFGVTGRGLFTSDIETSLKMEMGEGKWMTLSSKNKAIEYGKRVGEAVEDNARFANFIDGLRKGMKPEAAAKRVRKTLFDYSDLTDFEQQVMKRIFPFYTWTRKNVPFQLEQLVKHPGKYKAIDTLRQEVEAAAGKLDDNEKYLSEWMLANYPTKVKVEGGEARYFILGGWWAGADLWKLGSQPTKLATDLLHPVLKSMLEASTQLTDKKGYVTDLFSGQKLHPEMPTDYLWGTTSETTKHYLNNLRVLNTIDEFVRAYYNEKGEGPKKLSPFVKEPKTIEEALLAFFTGIRTFSVDLERQKLFFTQGKGKESELYKELVSKAIKAGRTDEEIKVLMDKGIESIQDLQGMATGGLVSQAERLGFNKGGAVSLDNTSNNSIGIGEQQRLEDYSNTSDNLLPITEGNVVEEPSMWDNISTDYDKRLKSMDESRKDRESREISLVRSTVNTAGAIAGLGFDVAGAVIEESVSTYLDNLKSFAPSTYADTSEKVTEAKDWALNTEAGQVAVAAAQKGYEEYSIWKKDNPQDAKTFEAVLNIGMFGWGAKGIASQMLKRKKPEVLPPINQTKIPPLLVDKTKQGLKVYSDKNASFLNVKKIDDSMVVTNVNVDPTLRRRGVALSMYEEAVKDATTRGVNLTSDMTVKLSAIGVYKKLEALGYDVSFNKNTTDVVNDYGVITRFSTDDLPVVTVHTKKPTEVLPITNKEAERDTALMTLLDDLPVGKQLVIDNSKDYYENDIDYNSAEWFENIARGSEVTVDGNNIIIKKIKEIKLGDIETAVVFPESGKVTIMIPQAGELILEKGGKYNNIEGEWSIETVGLSDEFKNKGLGVKLYLKAVEELLKKGDYAASYLSSGGMTTESAMRVWRSLYKNPDKYLKEFPQLKGTFSIHTNEKNMIVHDNGPKGEKQYEQDIDSEPAYSIELDPSAYEKNIIKRRTPKKPKAAMPAKKTQDPTLTIKVDDKQQSLERAPVGMGLEQMANDNIALVGGLRSGNSKGDETRLKYTVYDYKAIQANNDMDNANDYILGDVELFVEDGTGKVRGLVELNIKDKRKGTGRKVIEALMASDFVNDDFNIHSIKKSAIPFWEKMGIEFNNKRTIGDYRGDGILRKEDSVKKTKATMPAKKTQDPTITTKVVDKAMMPPKVSLVSRLPKKQKDFNLEQDNHDGTWSQGREYPGGEKSYERIKIPYKYDVKYKDGTRKPYELYNVGFDKKTKQYRVLKVRGDDQQVVSVSRDEFDSILKDTHPDLKVESVTKYY